MAEPKTRATSASVTDFLDKVTPEQKRQDAYELLKMYKEVTSEKPVMWEPSIVGFGKYRFKSEKRDQEGDWPLAAFSPRKKSLTILRKIIKASYSHTKKKYTE